MQPAAGLRQYPQSMGVDLFFCAFVRIHPILRREGQTGGDKLMGLSVVSLPTWLIDRWIAFELRAALHGR